MSSEIASLWTSWLLVAVMAAGGVALAASDSAPSFESLAPVIYAERIEPCLPFWTERLGFEVLDRVNYGEGLGFVILQRGDVTVMYQSFASAEEDTPGVAAPGRPPGTALFLTVRDFDALLSALEGVEVVVAERRTDYAEREIFVRAPCGTVVGFALLSS